MKKALVALDSTSCSGKNFEKFCDALKWLQEEKVLPAFNVVSVLHPFMTPLPGSHYREQKKDLMNEAEKTVRAAVAGCFAFESVKVLSSESPVAEDLVELMSRFGRESGADLLALASNDRSGIPNWLLGSFSETASLVARISMLVVKPSWNTVSFSRKAVFVLALDPESPPPSSSIAWVAVLAKRSGAVLELVHVNPKRRILGVPRSELAPAGRSLDWLKTIQAKFEGAGVKAACRVVPEEKSVARSLVQFAEEKCAWLLISFASENTRGHRIVLGSRARQMLALSKRPFLNVRLCQ